MNILSWNIFMNPELIEKRTLDICNIIKKEDPDVICLQEVVPQTFNIIKTVYNSTKNSWEVQIFERV